MTCPALCVVAFLPISGFHVGAVSPGEKPALQRHLPHTHPRETWEGRADGTVGMKIIFPNDLPTGRICTPFCTPLLSQNCCKLETWYQVLQNCLFKVSDTGTVLQSSLADSSRHLRKECVTIKDHSSTADKYFGTFGGKGCSGASMFISSYRTRSV